MNTPPLQAAINQCVETYERITGFTNGRGICANLMAWTEYLRAGFTAQDLEFVLNHLMREIRKGDRKLGCLRISTLVMDTQRFGEELDLARAMERNRPKPATPRQQIVSQFRREPVKVEVEMPKSIGHYIEALRNAAL